MAAEVVTQLAANRNIEIVTEQPFYIPMTGPAARPRRSLKHDDTFIVLDSHGDIGASAGGPDGLFNADTRYLARLEMVLDDMQPLLLGSNLRDDNSALTIDLTNSDVYRNGRLVLQKDTLHIVRSIFLWRGTAYQRIGLQKSLACIGGRFVREQMIEGGTKGIDVRTDVCVNIAAAVLFERGVKRCALSLNDRDRDLFGCKDLHESEVHQLDQAVRHEFEVARLDITMDNRWLLAVQEGERVRNLVRPREHVRFLEEEFFAPRFQQQSA